MNKLLRLLCPKAYNESLPSVDLNALREKGIQALILDMDNTLVAWSSREISAEVRAWIQTARDLGMRIAVASNNFKKSRLNGICSELKINIYEQSAKPRRGALLRAMDALESRPESTALVGDQLFTDVLGGNRIGCYTILLRPISKREFFGTRIDRLIESIALRWLARKGVLPKMGS